MILCVCKRLVEKDTEELLESGMTLAEVVKATGLGTQCGVCIKYLVKRRDVGDRNSDDNDPQPSY